MSNESELTRPERHLVLISRYFYLPGFVIVGILFVTIPNGVLGFSNSLTQMTGFFDMSNLSVERFWLVLAGF